MGSSAFRTCNAPGCPVLLSSGERYCAKHAQKNKKQSYANRKEKPHLRIYDTSRWRYQLRPMKLRNDPYCESGVICDADNIGRRAQATEVHHIQSTEEFPALAFVYENLMSICKACHSHETARSTQDFAKPKTEAA
jgi:5-methylcytosine-specific restriction endonuclease McrA